VKRPDSRRKFRASTLLLAILLIITYTNQGSNVVNEAVQKILSVPYALLYRHEKRITAEFKKTELTIDQASEAEAARLRVRSRSGDVIRRSISPFQREVVLNIGSAEGVRNNDYVLHNGSLVGRVSKLLKNECWVILISDPSFRLPVSLEGVKGEAILKGNVNSVIIDRIPPTDNLQGRAVSTFGNGVGELSSVPVGTIGGSANDGNSSVLMRFQLASPVREEYVSRMTVIGGDAP
jgi:cell shape-determining protein MreC